MDGWRENWIRRKLNDKVNIAKYEFQTLDDGTVSAKYRMILAFLYA